MYSWVKPPGYMAKDVEKTSTSAILDYELWRGEIQVNLC